MRARPSVTVLAVTLLAAASARADEPFDFEKDAAAYSAEEPSIVFPMMELMLVQPAWTLSVTAVAFRNSSRAAPPVLMGTLVLSITATAAYGSRGHTPGQVALVNSGSFYATFLTFGLLWNFDPTFMSGTPSFASALLLSASPYAGAVAAAIAGAAGLRPSAGQVWFTAAFGAWMVAAQAFYFQGAAGLGAVTHVAPKAFVGSIFAGVGGAALLAWVARPTRLHALAAAAGGAAGFFAGLLLTAGGSATGSPVLTHILMGSATAAGSAAGFGVAYALFPSRDASPAVSLAPFPTRGGGGLAAIGVF